MKKLLLILPLALFLVGCDQNDEADLDVYATGHYINTTESISVQTFNGFKLIKSKVIKDKDGSYRVILDIDKPIR